MEKQRMPDSNAEPFFSSLSPLSPYETSENSVAHRQALLELIDETTRLFHFLSALTSHLHASEHVAALCRTILRDLRHAGAQSVPSLARAQNVTRQSIQARVNTLVQEGWVILQPNPAHKRSPLVTLTPQGKMLLERLEQRESEVLAHVQFRVSASQLQTTAESLHAIRAWLMQEQQRLQIFLEPEEARTPIEETGLDRPSRPEP
jgi:DNA-binding MarR family transcriptional regulator